MHVLLEIVGNVVDGRSLLRVPDDDDENALSPDELTNYIRMDTVCLLPFFPLFFSFHAKE